MSPKICACTGAAGGGEGAECGEDARAEEGARGAPSRPQKRERQALRCHHPPARPAAHTGPFVNAPGLVSQNILSPFLQQHWLGFVVDDMDTFVACGS